MESSKPRKFSRKGQEFVVRLMKGSDLDNGLLEVLEVLADVDLAPSDARKVFWDRLRTGVRTFVATQSKDSKETVIGTATLLIERKYIHRGGRVGHIEDVAVRGDLHGMGWVQR